MLSLQVCLRFLSHHEYCYENSLKLLGTGLAWLLQSIHQQLSQSLAEKEVRIICTDLIWALFICPAVTNPEPFGVTDAPVGTQERHILSQVATILQSLALFPYEPHPQHLAEYISFFDTVRVSKSVQLHS